MKINLRVKYNDGISKEIVCSAKDLVAFEEKYSRSVARLESEFKLTDLLFLAWHSEKRTSSIKKEFDNWLDEVDEIGVSETDPK
jgi:hypothetical protein